MAFTSFDPLQAERSDPHTRRMMDLSSSHNRSQVEVVFMTELDNPNYHISGGLKPGGQIMLPITLTRRGLSEIVNSLLGLDEPVAFDFLIELPNLHVEEPQSETKPSRLFLRTSLSKFMKRYGITSETGLTLYYMIARSKFESSNYTSIEDWVVGLSCITTNHHQLTTIASASADGTCKIYESDMTHAISVLPSPPISSVSHLSGSSYESLSSIKLIPVDGDTQIIETIATSQTGEIIIGYHRSNKNLGVTVTTKGKCDYGGLTSISVSNDNSIISTGCSSGQIQLWDNQSCKEAIIDAAKSESPTSSKKRSRTSETVANIQYKGILEGHNEQVTGICSPASRWPFNLFSASLDQTVRVWDIISQSPTCTWSCTRAATSITASPEGRHFATTHDDGRVRVWDIRDGKVNSGTELPSQITSTTRAPSSAIYHIHRRQVSQAAWNPSDEQLIASVSHDGSLKIIDIRSPKMAVQTVSFTNTKLLCVEWIDCNRCVTGVTANSSSLRIITDSTDSRQMNLEEKPTPPAKRQRRSEPNETDVTSNIPSEDLPQLNLDKKSDVLVERSIDERQLENKEEKDSENLMNTISNSTKSIQQEKPIVIHWPWIPLTDSKSGRTYYFNALTNLTTWEVPKNDSISQAVTEKTDRDTSKDSTTDTSITSINQSLMSEGAQKAWQEYWNRWQATQAANSNLQLPLSAKEHVVTDDESQRGPALGIADGANVTPNMIVYVEHYKSPTARQLGRPAKQQVRPPDTSNLGYTQGSEEYNIWYGKYLSDRWENGRREDREKATTRCNPFSDSGWTKADVESELDRPVICLYFAKGCCYMGTNCRYYHRVPTAEDNDRIDELHDIFGRERFAHHRDDMSGVGAFTEDCRSLFVGDLKVHRVYPNAEDKTEQLIRQQFGLWGSIEEIKVIRNRNIAFVRYKYRVHAEFAKVAMAEQKLLLDREDDQICVRWAYPGRNAGKKSAEEEAREWEVANKAMMKRLDQLGYSQEDLECFVRWEIQKAEREGYGVRPPVTASDDKPEPSVISKYPNTDDRIKAAMATSAQMAEMYPEVKRIIKMSERKGPVPLESQVFIDVNETKLLYNDSKETQLEAMVMKAKEEAAIQDTQRMDKVLNKVDKMKSADVFKIDI